MKMRRIAALAALVLVPAAPATAAPSSPTLTIEGPLGTARITEERIRQLMSEAEGVSRADGDAFLARLSHNDQIALNYAVNASLITGFDSTGETDALGPCGATIEDCDPPKPRQPRTEVEKPVPSTTPAPTPPPPVCRFDDVVLEATTAFFSTVAYEFKHTVHWCYDQKNVTQVDQLATYDVKWPIFWTCHVSEIPQFPRYDQLPWAPAPTVQATATGHCTYTARVKVEVFGREFEVALPPMHDYPSITQQMRYDGGCARLIK